MSKIDIEAILETGYRRGTASLTESESKHVLSAVGIDVPREEVAGSEEEAGEIAGRMGFPVVLKVSSPDVPHKSDAGGVQIGLTDREATCNAYLQIMDSVKHKHPQADIQGVLVQEMIGRGVETIAGITNRPPFGPVITFGLGGIFVELLKDVTFRLAPLDETVAHEMLTEIQGARMLDGYRSGIVADKLALAQVLVRLSELATRFGDCIEELDINPLLVTADRVVALDGLVVLRKNGASPVMGRTGKTSHADQHGSAAVHVDQKPINDIRSLLEPRSIAVIGASANSKKTGHILLKNIIANGFPGAIYPINPKCDEILGYKAYPTIEAVPEEVDLAFFLLPGEFVPALLTSCQKKGVKAAVVIAAGFSEVGEEGAKAQAELEELISRSGVRCVGPNTIGFVNMEAKLVASFAFFENWEDGPIALAAQSGIFAGAVADQLMHRQVQRLGIGTSLPFGNKIDLDESDFVEWAGKNPKIKVIALHIEGMRQPRRLLSLANQLKREKPIIVLKSGRTEAGTRAAASHTGSLAMDDVLVDHAFRQYGLIRAYDMEEFLEFMKAFSYLPVPGGDRVGIVTFSGASAVMASDELTEQELQLAQLGPATCDRVRKLLPPWQPVNNPLDLWPGLGAGSRLVHEEGLNSVLDDENVDAVLFILVALANADFDGMDEILGKARERHPDKPILTVMEGGQVKEKWLREIEGLKAPVFETTRIAVRALAAMRRYALNRQRVQLDPLLVH